MKQKLILYISVVLSIFMIIGCKAPANEKIAAINNYLPTDTPEDIWVSQAAAAHLDSIVNYYNTAEKKLAERDTLGAEIFFKQAFEVIARFKDEERSVLQGWVRYDTLFHRMNADYERVYLNSNELLEAEEIRQDIAEIEEFSLSDSVLNSESTVIDTSGEVPITINRKVRLAIKYFQTKGRFVFTRWLERSGRYEPLVRQIFREENVPEDLVYLAMIESGFNPSARSYARAVGMWQFISATGRYYGLRHNWWFDERRDVIKASRAAAQHLKDLYQRFDDWYLALSGYNCNPRKVEKNIRIYKTRDFWKLRRLPRQTRNYVPTYLAAAIIANEPEKFGFTVKKQEPIQFDTVTVSESLDLNVVARLTGSSYKEIRHLNPAVLRWVTPPGIKDFTLYLPAGTRQQFLAGYRNIPDSEKRSWVRHKIRRGEALSTIARKYHTSISVIKSTNKLRSNFIRAGHYLLIPVPQNKAAYYASLGRKSGSSKHRSRKRPAIVKQVPGHKKVVYTIKPGDTLGEIAERFQTRASKIRSWNGLRYGDYIRPKQKLAIWVPENLDELKARVAKKVAVKEKESGTFYTVRIGDTLWDIAKKYNTSISAIKKLNRKRNSRIRPGERLKVSKN